MPIVDVSLPMVGGRDFGWAQAPELRRACKMRLLEAVESCLQLQVKSFVEIGISLL